MEGVHEGKRVLLDRIGRCRSQYRIAQMLCKLWGNEIDERDEINDVLTGKQWLQATLLHLTHEPDRSRCFEKEQWMPKVK